MPEEDLHPHPPWIKDGPVGYICENCKSQFPWHTEDCPYHPLKKGHL